MSHLKFTEQDWERVMRDVRAWWAGELDRPLVYLVGFDRMPLPPRYSYFTNYPLEMPVEQIVDQYVPYLQAANFYGDAFPWLWINFGPGIAAAFMGANANSVTEPSETVWFTPTKKVPIHELTLEYDPENVWWKRVKGLTAAFIERFDRQIILGHTDLGGNLDILASFCGTDGLLYDLMDAPEEVDRLVRRITELWLRYYDELDTIIRPALRGTSTWVPLLSPGKTYMLQSDFSYMISPAMFERFVMPDLTACCDHLDHGFYHLDGKGEIPHLGMLLSIERLRGIQWIPGDGQPPPDQWLDLLKRIRDGGKLCQVMVTAEGARRIVKNLGGKGFLLLISDPELVYCDAEQAAAFLNTLAAEDLSSH